MTKVAAIDFKLKSEHFYVWMNIITNLPNTNNHQCRADIRSPFSLQCQHLAYVLDRAEDRLSLQDNICRLDMVLHRVSPDHRTSCRDAQDRWVELLSGCTGQIQRDKSSQQNTSLICTLL